MTVHNPSSLKDDGSLLSFGLGVEREVLYTAFRSFTDSTGAWFLPRFDDRCSITTTMTILGPGFISSDRRDKLRILGCLSALMLIHGIAPEPLSPALIQFAANNYDVGALTWDFVGEWHPELRSLLDSWIAIGAGGDIAPFQPHFATFHNTHVSCVPSADTFIYAHSILDYDPSISR